MHGDDNSDDADDEYAAMITATMMTMNIADDDANGGDDEHEDGDDAHEDGDGGDMGDYMVAMTIRRTILIIMILWVII